MTIVLYFIGVQQFAHLSGSCTKTIKVFAYFTILLSVISDTLLVYSYYTVCGNKKDPRKQISLFSV